MKKLILLGLAAALVLSALGAVGLAYAQTPTTQPDPGAYPCPMGGQAGYHRGLMSGPGGFGRGMMSRSGLQAGNEGCLAGTPGAMHEYQIAAFAKALNLTPEVLNERLAAGETLWTIAEEQGLSAEDFRQVKLDAHAEALALAVEAGVITQEQADTMQQRMQGRGFGQSQGAGPGSCHANGSGMRGMRGRR